MFSNIDGGREARVALSFIMDDNTLARMYLQPQFTNVFKLSDGFNINNDGVRYVSTSSKSTMTTRKIYGWNLMKIDYKVMYIMVGVITHSGGSPYRPNLQMLSPYQINNDRVKYRQIDDAEIA